MFNVAEVLKYEGDNKTFVWKHPSEDFNNRTQLIVHESQEAIFLLNGQALDTFGPGRYTLETENIPLLARFLRLLSGNSTPFHAEVYFINKSVQMGIKWGTDSKVRYVEPKYGFPMELGASGSMNMLVKDSRKLLLKLVGTMKGISWEERGDKFSQSLQSCFRPVISMAVKSNLSSAIKAEDFDILEIDEHLEKLSDILHKKIEPEFEEYGIAIPQFYITAVVLPEEDVNFRRLRELHTVEMQKRMIKAEAEVRSAKLQADTEMSAIIRENEMELQRTKNKIAEQEAERGLIFARQEAEKKRILAQGEADALRYTGMAEAEVMQAKGYSQKDVFETDVQKAYAEGIGHMGAGGTEGSGGVASSIIGASIGARLANTVVEQMNTVGTASGNKENSVKESSGNQKDDELSAFSLKIDKLQIMHVKGLITDEEFEAKKAELLKSIMESDL